MNKGYNRGYALVTSPRPATGLRNSSKRITTI